MTHTSRHRQQVHFEEARRDGPGPGAHAGQFQRRPTSVAWVLDHGLGGQPPLEEVPRKPQPLSHRARPLTIGLLGGVAVRVVGRHVVKEVGHTTQPQNQTHTQTPCAARA